MDGLVNRTKVQAGFNDSRCGSGTGWRMVAPRNGLFSAGG
jgi:hypothetical protein